MPVEYANATKLSAASLRALGDALAAWNDLPFEQQQALRNGWASDGGPQPGQTWSRRIRVGLRDAGLIRSLLDNARLTPLGMFVRDAGLSIYAEVDHG